MGRLRSAEPSIGSASICRSFPPVAAPDARVLILGSMPGAASLAAGRYYAHPRNLFWPLLGALLGVDPAADYGERTAALLAAKLALWDVLAACERRGSLDSAIAPDSMAVNDFPGFLEAHPSIRRICFNGAAAETIFKRRVVPRILAAGRPVPALVRLPSTSPANAAWSFERRLAAWGALLGGDQAPPPPGAASRRPRP